MIFVVPRKGGPCSVQALHNKAILGAVFVVQAIWRHTFCTLCSWDLGFAQFVEKRSTGTFFVQAMQNKDIMGQFCRPKHYWQDPVQDL